MKSGAEANCPYVHVDRVLCPWCCKAWAVPRFAVAIPATSVARKGAPLPYPQDDAPAAEGGA